MHLGEVQITLRLRKLYTPLKKRDNWQTEFIRFREALDKLKENRDEVLSDLKETTFSKDYLSTQLEHLQSEQNIAVNQEDFALADKVNQQIEVKQSELRNLKYQHPILDQKVFM